MIITIIKACCRKMSRDVPIIPIWAVWTISQYISCNSWRDKALRKLNGGQTRKRCGRGRGDTIRENRSECTLFSLCSGVSLAPSLIVSSFDLLIYPLRSTNEKYINKNKQTNKAKQKLPSAYLEWTCPQSSPASQVTVHTERTERSVPILYHLSSCAKFVIKKG